MGGYVIVIGPCLVCGNRFGYNPTHVPSHPARRVNGQLVASSDPKDPKEPICRICIERLNAMRRKQGLREWTIHPDAYEPAPEEEVF